MEKLKGSAFVMPCLFLDVLFLLRETLVSTMYIIIEQKNSSVCQSKQVKSNISKKFKKQYKPFTKANESMFNREGGKRQETEVSR